jgi:TonB family protein
MQAMHPLRWPLFRPLLVLVLAATGGATTLSAAGVYFGGLSAQVTQSFKMAPGGPEHVAPMPAHFPLPEYPAAMIRAGIVGFVRLSCTVGSDGRVTEVEVLEATSPDFAPAAKAAVTAWRFQPLATIRSDYAQRARLLCRIEFRFVETE